MHLIIHTDGGSLHNPGPAASAFLIHNGSSLLHSSGKAIGIASNNVAEYTALIMALEYVALHYSGKLQTVTVVADSQLMINQLNGVYKVKHPDMKPLYEKVTTLARNFAVPVTFTHVLREKNADADALVKKALAVK